MIVNCYYCINSKVIEENGIKKAVCSSDKLNCLVKDGITCTYSCTNYVPNAEQRAYDEYKRTHSVDYDEKAEARKARLAKRS